MEQKHGTQGPGNTKARSFLLTIFENELKDDDLAIYMTACEDTCKDGKHHFHQLFHYANPVSFNRIKKLYPTAHVERPRSLMNAINYIQGNKNGRKFNVIERGNKPHQGVPHTCEELKQLPKEEVPPNMLNTWLKLQPTKIKKSDWNKNVEVHYICGPSGIGKSNLAQELADDEFDEVKFVNGFWSPCSGEGCCIYDDFRSSHMSASEFINFIDYRTHNLNVKGGTVRNKYTKIIITSIQTIDQLYANMPSEAREQWIRRMIIHDLTPEITIDN